MEGSTRASLDDLTYLISSAHPAIKPAAATIVDDSRRRTKFMAQRAAAAAAGRARAGGRAQRRRGFRSSRARWLLICSAQCTFLDIRVQVIFVMQSS